MLPDRYYSLHLIPRPHVLILGAGASKAAELHGDSEGHILPLMNDLPDVIDLSSIVGTEEVKEARIDFETFFSRIASNPIDTSLAKVIEARIYDYFSSIPISSTITIYDQLVLSLRAKDCIATFNWDPLLGYAYRRNGFLGTLPELFFLHGNVLSGYCENDNVLGWTDDKCFKCNSSFLPSRLLFPIGEKNYSQDPLLKYQWERLQELLEGSWFVSIFGYSAPRTDKDASSRIISALEKNDVKRLMEIEVINPQHQELLRQSGTIGAVVNEKHSFGFAEWKLAYCLNFPRFTIEALFESVMQNDPLPAIAIPSTSDLSELQGWYQDISASFPAFLHEGYSKISVKGEK